VARARRSKSFDELIYFFVIWKQALYNQPQKLYSKEYSGQLGLGGKLVRYFAIAVILLLIMIGVAWGDVATDAQFIYKMDQSVQGTGFHNYRENVSADGLRLNNAGHGSGSYNYEAKLSIVKQAKYDEFADTGESGTGERNISYDESVDYTFAPEKFSFGKTFESGAFNSLGSEGTSIRNNHGLMSMDARFDSIKTMSTNLFANAYWFNSSDDPTNLDLDTLTSVDRGYTKLNVDSAFTGLGHIGVLGLVEPGLPDAKHLQVANLIDEDYLGTYKIEKKMSQTFNTTRIRERDDWLPCCSNGFAGMNFEDQKPFKSAKGVFDCTCFKVSTQAQFPRVY
jgi:hypothetical protein